MAEINIQTWLQQLLKRGQESRQQRETLQQQLAQQQKIQPTQSEEGKIKPLLVL